MVQSEYQRDQSGDRRITGASPMLEVVWRAMECEPYVGRSIAARKGGNRHQAGPRQCYARISPRLRGKPATLERTAGRMLIAARPPHPCPFGEIQSGPWAICKWTHPDLRIGGVAAGTARAFATAKLGLGR